MRILLDSNSLSLHIVEHPVTTICLWKENKTSLNLTASTSAGSYQTLMYGCCKASSTDILFAGSITSIFDSKSLAWLAEKRMNEEKNFHFGKEIFWREKYFLKSQLAPSFQTSANFTKCLGKCKMK